MKLIKKTAYTVLPALLVSMSTGIYAKETCLETLTSEIMISIPPELKPFYAECIHAVKDILDNMFNMRYRILIKRAECEINNFAKFVNQVNDVVSSDANSANREQLIKVNNQLKKLLSDLQALIDLLKQYIGKKGFVAATELSIRLATQYDKIAPRSLQNEAKRNPLAVRKKLQKLLDEQQDSEFRRQEIN